MMRQFLQSSSFSLLFPTMKNMKKKPELICEICGQN